jgi:hypothetical protein
VVSRQGIGSLVVAVQVMLAIGRRPYNKKIQPELESCAIFEGSKPTNIIRLQSHNANLSNPVNFGRYIAWLHRQFLFDISQIIK